MLFDLASTNGTSLNEQNGRFFSVPTAEPSEIIVGDRIHALALIPRMDVV